MWDHRIMKRTFPNEVLYQIHEVFYDDEDNVDGWTENPVTVSGIDMEDLKKGYKLIGTAFEKPVLDWDTGKEAGE